MVLRGSPIYHGAWTSLPWAALCYVVAFRYLRRLAPLVVFHGGYDADIDMQSAYGDTGATLFRGGRRTTAILAAGGIAVARVSPLPAYRPEIGLPDLARTDQHTGPVHGRRLDTSNRPNPAPARTAAVACVPR